MTDSTAIAQCCARISKRVQDVRLLVVPGLADDLRSIGEAFGILEQQQRLLARAALCVGTGSDIPRDDFNGLLELSREPS